jgi:hypothetical protein
MSLSLFRDKTDPPRFSASMCQEPQRKFDEGQNLGGDLGGDLGIHDQS